MMSAPSASSIMSPELSNVIVPSGVSIVDVYSKPFALPFTLSICPDVPIVVKPVPPCIKPTLSPDTLLIQ